MLVGSTVKVKGSCKKVLTIIAIDGQAIVCGWYEKGKFCKKKYAHDDLVLLSPPVMISSIF
ncbi:hypothetical protein ACVWWU_003951 [Pantoea sp. PA1]|jgi:hypothetical protein|uniref:hypothetical protein n=1 Tax=Pantoea ananas TaxID=553 RepID=UPI000D790618|nr:hypothetical protein [Pantoea ananatis]PWK09846.1 hypothetical protein C7421_103159 [Pantoea ananatis]